MRHHGMNRFVAHLFVAFSLCSSLVAAEDLLSPKPASSHAIRVLLYIPGGDRMIDYPDVLKVLCSSPQQIAFETQDGYTVVHQGAYTLIQQRAAFAEHVTRGIRFYDAK